MAYHQLSLILAQLYCFCGLCFAAWMGPLRRDLCLCSRLCRLVDFSDATVVAAQANTASCSLGPRIFCSAA